MRWVKYAVWLAGVALLVWLAHVEGFGNGSAYIQFADGALLVYGAGEYVHKRAHIKRFIDNHKRMHERVEHLHEKFDQHIQRKEGDDD